MTWCLCQAYPYTTATSTCLPGAVVHSLKSEYEKFLFEINFNKSKDWTLRNVAEKKGKRSSKLGRLRICISELSKQLIAAPTSLYTHACRVKGMSKEGSYPPPRSKSSKSNFTTPISCFRPPINRIGLSSFLSAFHFGHSIVTAQLPLGTYAASIAGDLVPNQQPHIETPPTTTKYIPQAMASTPSTAKGRGRAKKTETDSSAPPAAVAAEAPTATAATTGETPKRGRGRPRKVIGEGATPKKAAPVPGRGRGRPPGSVKNPNATPKPKKPSSGRPRGRPPGSGKKQLAAAGKADSASAKAAALAVAGARGGETPKKATKVGRGGPSKARASAAAAAKEKEVEEDEDADAESSPHQDEEELGEDVAMEDNEDAEGVEDDDEEDGGE